MLEADVLAVDLPGLNITGGASVTSHAGNGYLLQNLAEGFCFVLDPIQCATGTSYALVATARREAKDGFEIIGTYVVASRFRHNKSPLQI